MPGDVIDTLSLEITSNAKNAEQGIDRLVQSLSKLTKALSVGNTSGMDNLSKGIDRLCKSAERLSGLDFSKLNISGNFDGMTTLAQGMLSVSDAAEKLSKVKMGDITKSMTRLSKIANMNLTPLANSLAPLAGMDFSRLTELGTAVQGFVNSLAGADKVSSATARIFSALSQLTASAQNISVVTTQLPALSNVIQAFVTTMAGAPAVDAGTVSLVAALSGIAASGAKAQKAAEALPGITAAVENFVASLAKMPSLNDSVVKVVQALSQMSTSSARAGSAAQSLQNNITGLTGSMKGLKTGITGALKGMKSFTRQILSAMGIAGGLYTAFRGLRSAIDISSDLTEVQNVVDVTFGDMKSKVEDLAKTSIGDFGLSELTLKKISSRFQAMGVAMGFTQENMSDMSIELTKLAADMASFYNVSQEAVAQDLESVFTGMTRPLRAYGLDLTQATLQEWAMRNGINANVASMTQAEKTLLRYRYVLANTTAAQGDFAKTSMTWANQLRILVQSLKALGGIIGGTLINAFKPFVAALNTVMQKVIQFARTIANALGAIFGWTIEIGSGGTTNDLAGGFEDMEDSTGGAAGNLADANKNAKKLKNTVLSFDELNILNGPDEDTDTGSGAGGGGGAGGLGDLGDGAQAELKRVESLFDKYESEIKNLYQLGEYIGDALTHAMDSIDWDRIYNKARNFGKGLADFLNGLISPELFGAVGRTIAGALNTAIYAALSFGETFEWAELGDSIAEGVNQFFETFDFGDLANTIDAWAQGAWEAVKTAIEGIEWDTVWDGIKEFLSELDIETVEIVIGAIVVKKILGAHILSGALKSIKGEIPKLLTDALTTLKTSILPIIGGLGESFSQVFALVSSGVMPLGEAISAVFGSAAAAISGVSSVIGGAITAVLSFFSMWENGFSVLKEIIMGIGIAITAVGAVILGAAAGAAAAVAGIVAAVATAAIVIHDNWDSIVEFFQDLPEKIGPALSNVAEWFRQLPENIKSTLGDALDFLSEKWNSFVEFMTGIPERIGEIISSIFVWFDELPSKIGSALGYALGTVTKWGVELYGYLTTKIPEIINSVIDWFRKLPGRIAEFLSNVWSNFTSWGGQMLSSATQFASQTISSIINWFQQLPGKISSLLQRIISNVVSWGTSLVSKGASAARELYNAVVNGIISLPSRFISIGYDLVTGLWSGIQSALGWLRNMISDFCDSVLSGFRRGFSIHSPSKKAYEIGDLFTQGLQNGITERFGDIYSDITKFTKDIGNMQIKAPKLDLSAAEWNSDSYITDKVAKIQKAEFQASTDLSGMYADVITNAVAQGMMNNSGSQNPIYVNATLYTEDNEILARAVTRGQEQIDRRYNPSSRY